MPPEEPDHPNVPEDDGPTQNAHRHRVTRYSIGDAVIATDTQARITFINPVAESLTGWTADEAIGQPLARVFNILHQDTRRTAENPVDKSIRQGVIVGLASNTLLIAKDGTERLIDHSAAPFLDEQNNVTEVVLVFRDITEHYRQEQTIRETLAYAQNIIATLREPFLILDNNLQVQSANRSFYETFQVSQEQTEGCLVYVLGNGQWDIPQLRTVLNEVLKDHHPITDFEVEHAFPTIGHKTMRLNASRIRQPGDHSNLILLAIEDITHRKQAQAALLISERRYRRLFESAKDGILILDAHTMRIIDSNPFMHELLGYTAEQFHGKELWEIGLFHDKSDSQAAVRELQERGYVRYEDLPLKSERGKVQDVEFVCNVYEEDGHRIAQCNIRDITQRKRMEQEIHDQAREMATASRRKDEFLAMLSHELRNPLAPMFNALQLIGQAGGENELQREARGVMDRQVRHLSRLIGDLLEVSRITTGRISLHIERVDLNGIIKGAVEGVLPNIERRRQKLAFTLAEDVVWLNADASRLEQVFGNLLNNASKYNNHGGHIWLTVETTPNQAIVRVRDDGMGMARDMLPNIFDLFTQADKSMDRAEGGLGIGLALVKSLVELHRGTVEVESEGIGRGSAFTVRLPLASASPFDDESSPAPIPETVAESLRILVVDDSVDAAKMSAMLLRSWGHEVRISHNGPDALERATGFVPHVILCDIGLPDMDGYEVARRIRKTAHLKDMVLVAVTGYGQDSDKRHAREAGFDHHMLKPVELADLKNLLAGLQPHRSDESP